MAYQLKKIQYNKESYYILLQNKNGPCPLLAAGNVLILKKSISLPSNCIKAGVVTIEELTNVLAEKMLANTTGRGNDHHVNEVLKIFPNLQFGMDVNPKFTAGPTGVEYTMELNAFDLLHIEMVHGWLLGVDDEIYAHVARKSYNELLDVVIEGNDAIGKLTKLKNQSEHDNCNLEELSNKATRGTIVRNFLDQSSHQLTQYGLTVLHEYVKEGDMVIFFRNNHFNMLTKFEDHLYILVTDLGYANVHSVVWEKLDVIDGDTEYVNEHFKVPPVNHHGVNSDAATIDYHLALQLSRETSVGNTQPDSNIEQAKMDSLLELQYHQQNQMDFQNENTHSRTFTSATIPGQQISKGPASDDTVSRPTIAVGIPIDNLSQEQSDMMVAIQLQRQEEKERQRQHQQQQQSTREQIRTRLNTKDSSCIIS